MSNEKTTEELFMECLGKISIETALRGILETNEMDALFPRLCFAAEEKLREQTQERNRNVTSRYEFYNDYGCAYFETFIERNPEFNTPEFREYVELHNRGDRDSGEIQDVAKHEILRLAQQFVEYKWRFM